MVARKTTAPKKGEVKLTPAKRKIVRKISAIASGEQEVVSCYCRKCCETKRVNEFYKTMDKYLDANGYMSVCKDCLREMYSVFFQTERAVEKTILRICRMMNVQYNDAAIQSLELQLENKGKAPDDETVFGIYLTRLIAANKKHFREGDVTDDMDLTFYEPTTSVNVTDPLLDTDFGSDDLVSFWGSGGYSYEDYKFLEKELAAWRKSHRIESRAEIVIVREICRLMLGMEKDRIEGKSSSGKLKDLRDLMKDGTLSPNTAGMAGNANKGEESWGMFIKMIENTTPADNLEKYAMYRDVDNVEKYNQDYMVRPLKNFVMTSKDFRISGDDDSEEVDYSAWEESVVIEDASVN